MLDMEAAIDRIRAKEGFLCDMDGVIYHGNRLLDGAKELWNGCIGRISAFCF